MIVIFGAQITLRMVRRGDLMEFLDFGALSAHRDPLKTPAGSATALRDDFAHELV